MSPPCQSNRCIMPIVSESSSSSKSERASGWRGALVLHLLLLCHQALLICHGSYQSLVQWYNGTTIQCTIHGLPACLPVNDQWKVDFCQAASVARKGPWADVTLKEQASKHVTSTVRERETDRQADYTRRTISSSSSSTTTTTTDRPTRYTLPVTPVRQMGHPTIGP